MVKVRVRVTAGIRVWHDSSSHDVNPPAKGLGRLLTWALSDFAAQSAPPVTALPREVQQVLSNKLV
jgi:hypothetical protein